MAGKSKFLENKFLNWFFNGATFTPPTSIFVALFTIAPTDTGGGTEVSGGSYARVEIPCDTTHFATTTTSQITNAVAVAFAQASAAWGNVVAFAVFDALTGGNMLFSNTITTKNVALNDTLTIGVGQLKFTED